MSKTDHSARLVLQCSRSCARRSTTLKSFQSKQFSSTPTQRDAEVEATTTATKPPPFDPLTVTRLKHEKRLMRAGVNPVASRRRRALMGAETEKVPFIQLPYQCFQEARKFLLADRKEKLHQIQVMRDRIARLKAQDPAISGGELRKKNRLQSMERELEDLKIKADINDPMVKKKFEDGQGDMRKPIYRFLANRKWREYKRPVLMQRIQQMSVVPDVLPGADPIMEVDLYFGRKRIAPGDFVHSTISEVTPRLHAQLFDPNERLCTIAVVDPDVPNPINDNFKYRCHFLACNIPISATKANLNLHDLTDTTPTNKAKDPSAASNISSKAQSEVSGSVSEAADTTLEDDASTAMAPSLPSSGPQTILPWLPPHAQKGAPYHRLSTFILHQKDNHPIDVDIAKKGVRRDGFKLVSFRDRHLLHPIGVHLFRTQFDDGMDGVMERAGVSGADVEFRRKRVEPLPYKRRNPPTFR
ncbi:MAG: hypothetical protein Q9227_005530 [Pyrenula ochraceoflavens]